MTQADEPSSRPTFASARADRLRTALTDRPICLPPATVYFQDLYSDAAGTQLQTTERLKLEIIK